MSGTETRCPVCGNPMDSDLICCENCNVADVLFRRPFYATEAPPVVPAPPPIEDAEIALGEAAREIPWVNGPVAHRIRVLRESHAEHVGSLEAELARLRALASSSSAIRAAATRAIPRLELLLARQNLSVADMDSGEWKATLDVLTALRAALSSSGASPEREP